MEDPVQHQLEAFNNRDVDAFMEAYASEIRVEDGSGEEMMSGTDEICAFYTNLFNNSPELHCEVVNRTSVGNWVIDEEKLQGLNAEGFPEEAHAVVAYSVSNGQITFVRMFS
jgi:hypothetical protein